MVDFALQFNDRSLLGVQRRRPAGVRRMWLYAKGAGTRYRKRPRLFQLGQFGQRFPIGAGAALFPRSAGWIELWAEVGGERTNSLHMRVLPRRC
jgi:hypothetical protein